MSKRPLLLDLFCGAGGAAMGYYRAGFDILGVDIAPQKRYPFSFIQADALDFLGWLIQSGDIRQFAAVHASPPCQANSVSRHIRAAKRWKTTPDLVTPMYAQLRAWGGMWVIENVVGAPMADAIQLCGSMFGLPIIRHRWFASSHLLWTPGPCHHATHLVEVIGGKIRGIGAYRNPVSFVTPGGHTQRREAALRKADGQLAMGIDWMTVPEMSEAIPPAYTHWIGRQLLPIVESEPAA